MFTGIIETVGRLRNLEKSGGNINFFVESTISKELNIDQSVSHNGVCLTVVDLIDGGHVVTAVEETLTRSNLGILKAGEEINLERSMPASGRFDGHIVQGHVDEVGICSEILEKDGSFEFEFQYALNSKNITVEKGSICINGVSLTCYDSGPDKFKVTIIPYTYGHTNFKFLKLGNKVNLEFDIIGKYIQRILSHN
ncbi:MAG: riboflavin synthase [Bacteroidetes bacterium]|nr:riboflavin synthase [Bacteroidota bacterium]MDA1121546.1 riboflavin synthase [Bacteroidota bacterium]